jgi:hypothetical protein
LHSKFKDCNTPKAPLREGLFFVLNFRTAQRLLLFADITHNFCYYCRPKLEQSLTHDYPIWHQKL